MALKLLRLLLVALLASSTIDALSIKTNPEDVLDHLLAHAHSLTKKIIGTSLASLADPFVPTNSLIIDGRLYYFTNILKGDGSDRDMVIMFSLYGTFYVPRFFYKSLSNGGWRACPRIEVVREQAFFSKGLRVHYTQETKPVEEILLHLEWAQEKSLVSHISRQQYRAIENLFDREFFNEETLEPAVFSYENELAIYDAGFELTPLHKYQPGQGFKSLEETKAKDIYEYFRSLKYPAGFLPNFRALSREYRFTHTLLGETKVKVFSAKLNGKDIEWHMAHDQAGRVWIDRINFKKQRINSYGIYDLVINSGLLTNKPLEYGLQLDEFLSEDLIDEEPISPFEEDPDIFDLSPLLDTLSPIKQFREAQGLSRLSGYKD